MQDWLKVRMAASPQKIALIIGVHTWTYAELDAMVGGTAVTLINHGIQPGDYVAALLPNSLEYVCLIHALARIGAVLVPLNTRLTVPELQWQVEHVGCKWLAHDETFSDTAERLNCQLLMVNCQLSMEEAPLTINNWQLTIDNLQAIVFTSGTSGKPKGAMITFANHFWSATASSYRLGIQPNDRWLSVLPLYHVGGLAVIFRSCLYGTAVILHNRFDLTAINRSLDNDRATLISLVPTMLRRLLQTRAHWPASLRLILLGGAAATPELIRQANERPRKLSMVNDQLPIVNETPLIIDNWQLTIDSSPSLIAPTYGLTEAASQVATMPPEEAARKPGSVGKPLMFTHVKIVGEDGEERPSNQIGEIVVTGPTVMAGYWRPETRDYETRDHQTHHSPLSTLHSLKTGDMGYLDDDGDLWIVQRRSDLIVSGGENVYPSEVEAVLRECTAVSQACVVGIPHPEWGQQVAAMVQLKPGQSVTKSELLAFSRERLAGYKIPRLVQFVTALPQTASGKIARGKVAEMMRELVRVNGVDYFVSAAGKGEPLVLLHGFTGSSANWEAATAVLAPHYRVITIDLLGHGRTDSPSAPDRYRMEQAAADIISILTQLNYETVHLLGYSMGGRLALYLALVYPQRFTSLVLESASPGLATEMERVERQKRDGALADRIEREGIRPFVNFWESLPLWDSQNNLSEQARRALRRQRLQNNPIGLANSLRGMGTGAQPSLWERLGELQMPVLLLAGEMDKKFVKIGEQMSAKMPSAQFQIVPGAGHTVHLESTAVFTQSVLKFLHDS